MVSSMTRGPDGNIWFTDSGVGKITPAGAVTYYSVPGDPVQITAGSDGNLWFGTDSGIGTITPAGEATEFPAPIPNGLAAGPDGNIWFTSGEIYSGGVVGKITPTGQVTTYPIPGGVMSVGAITGTRDGRLWFLATTRTTRLSRA